jgi:cohesin complex subunit SA-1/2
VDEDSDDVAESEDEEEAPAPRKKAKAARKPAAKKPKVNGTELHEKSRPVKLPSRPKAKGRKVAIADRSTEGLYGMRASCRKK